MSERHPIYVINLDRKPERLRHMMEQAQTLGITLQRIAAVDGQKLSRKQIPSYLHKAIDGSGRFFRALSYPEMAITMSHRLCWEKIARFTQHRYGVILEDDCLIKPDFPLLFDFLDRLDSHCHFIYLMDRDIYPKPKRTGFRNIAHINPWQLVEWRSNLSGANGYAVSPNFARALLAARDLSAVLEHAQITVAWQHGIRSFGIHPHHAPIRLNMADHRQSDNAYSLKKKQKFSGLKRIRYQLWRKQARIRHHLKTYGYIKALFWPNPLAAVAYPQSERSGGNTHPS